MFAKGLAASLRKPFIAVNHLEAHALTVRLTDNVPFPYLLLLVSGGHCQFIEVRDIGVYRILGQTLDDAVGEAFDKIASLLHLPSPGGPAVERLAPSGYPHALLLPRPLLGTRGCDMSFSGLKTAVRYAFAKNPDLRPEDICASFQAAVKDCLVDRTARLFQCLKSSLQHL